MKTLKLLLATLFLGLLTFYNVEAQSVSTKSYDFVVNIWDTYSPEMGLLTGPCTIHFVAKYDRFGNQIGLKANAHITTLTSNTTGEVFHANIVESDSFTSVPDIIIVTFRAILLGNMGTRLVCTETFEFNTATGEFVSLEHRHKQW